MSEEKELIPGLVVKSGNLSLAEISDEDLKKINKFTLKALSKDDVFIFKISACDNEIDDRNYAPFNLNALKDLKKLYIGKTVIKDHARKADNQIARVYDTELIETQGKATGAGEVFTTLQVKAYMLRTESTKDLIAEIEAGIKREVSTGTRSKHAYCSICGVDNAKTYCPHWGGREYDTVEGKKLCYFTLDGAKDAYEISLVAVPAQRRAGTTKAFKLDGEDELEPKTIEDVKKIEKENEEAEANIAIKAMDAFIFTQKTKNTEV